MNADLIEAMRTEALKMLNENGVDFMVYRSCWNCNPLHEHLRVSKFVIHCTWCGRFYYKGVDITEDENEP